MDRKTITEWIKWIMWVGSLVGMFTAWRVDKAKSKIEYEIGLKSLMEDVQELKQEVKETKDYVSGNKDNITRVVTWIELQSE